MASIGHVNRQHKGKRFIIYLKYFYATFSLNLSPRLCEQLKTLIKNIHTHRIKETNRVCCKQLFRYASKAVTLPFHFLHLYPALLFLPISARSWDHPMKCQFCSQKKQSWPGSKMKVSRGMPHPTGLGIHSSCRTTVACVH